MARLLQRPDVAVVSNPEFLREGTALHDALHPDRIVVGADDPEVAARVGARFSATGVPLIVTDARTAETITYASNAFLATKLRLANAVARMCEAVGADTRGVLLGMGYDHRIGSDYLRPGPGWGGPGRAKDTRALVHVAEEAGYRFDLLRCVVDANDEDLGTMVDRVRRAAGGSLDGSLVAAWGVTFKAGTDDRRNSPAVDIVPRLASEGARMRGDGSSACRPGPSGVRRRPDAGVRPDGVRPDARAARAGIGLPRPLRRLRRCLGPGALDRVGASLGRLRQGPVAAGHPGGGRHPEPARPWRRAPPRHRLHRRETAVSGRFRRVVTGGAGFLGSHLCDRLVAAGSQVVCVDDLSTGRRRNVAHLVDDPAFILVEAAASRQLPVEGPAVLHLASAASPPAYLARPLQTLAAGSEGTRRGLELAHAHRARFLLASTSEVSGDP